MSLQFILAGLSIVLIDVLLAGDNAVVIALAVRALPPAQRKIGILVGAGGAVVLRVGLTVFAARLLETPFIQLIGGLLILWIGVKLFIDADPRHQDKPPARTLWSAIFYITLADLTMSLDNVLAIAAASKGNIYLLLFGLGLSIPFVIFTSTLLSRLMDRFPIIVYAGAAVLGRVGGEMVMTDHFIAQMLEPSEIVRYIVEAVCAAGVVLAGMAISRRARPR